ncbi:hypothetical protein EJ02DRAFT_23283 [Clathrospora elynae]|uniref:5-nitroimidazole antibiotic resistance protein n=1 Tax=Clathrospora elynae TaxID=706981 RepID=A0A6A5SFH9_9PLEO|nr:hypothetical protein EJ02DRAFT_23283 [Clathrospora elynae]
MSDVSYTKEARNTVRRHRERAKYDFATVHAIVNASSILHVSFLPTNPEADPFPTILPMIGTMGSFANPSADLGDEGIDLYIHGHSASRFMKLPTSADADPAGIPVCVAASIFDGIKLALTPFNHSCNYRSAVLHGRAQLVTDEAEKNWALHIITDGLVPERWNNSRVPPTKAEMLSTSVLKVTVVSASAKINIGGPGDDRKDLKDEQVTGSVWAGVLPVWQMIGTPIEGANNKVNQVPKYLGAWIEEENAVREKYALEVSKDLPKKSKD